MRSRSLPPGVLRRGWGAALTPARDHSPHDPLAPASLPPAATPSPDEKASPELWKTLSREVRVQIGDKGAQPLFAEPHEPRNHAVLSSALSACNRLCHRFGHSPPLQGPLHVRNRMGGRIRRRHYCHTHPDQDGTLYVAPPTRPARGPTFFCRAGPTWAHRLAGSSR